MSAFLFVRDPRMEEIWPFVPERLIAGLRGLGETRVVELERNERLSDAADLGDVVGIAWFGGRFSEACAEAATQLRMVGCNTDNTGHGLPLEQLRSRAIPVVDTTRAWAQSVAEIALGLAISGLRRIPQWHAELASGQPSFCYQAQQFCDAQGFVGGELGSRRVGVLGLGQIGGRVARWCVALARDAATGPDGGDRVLGCDPYLPPGRAESWGVTLVDPDRLVEESEVLFVTTPPTPSATRLLSEARIGRLRKGALVVIVTRAHAVDMAALRRRVLADELCAAFDVYDVEPLPTDDPLRGRANVVHVPHIAGRTRDANHRTADLIVEDFRRVLAGEPPRHSLTDVAIRVRTQSAP